MLLRKNSQNVPKDLSFCRNCNFVRPRHQNVECFFPVSYIIKFSETSFCNESFKKFKQIMAKKHSFDGK